MATTAAPVLIGCVLFSAESFAQTGASASSDNRVAAPRPVSGPTHTDIKGAFQDSLSLLTVEHAFRVAFQGKTRRELGGSFFGDYASPFEGRVNGRMATDGR